jgi:hypothetical protein
MKNNELKGILSIIALLALLVLIASNPAFSAIQPPGMPTLTPSINPGGGSGSSGGSSYVYTPPKFEAWSEPLLTSDGRVTGNLTGKSFTSVLLWARNNTTIDNRTITVTLEAELGQKPDTCWLDMIIEKPTFSGLPVGMCSTQPIAAINITRYCKYAWDLKADSLKLNVEIDGQQAQDEGVYYYLVRFDGTNYILNPAKMTISGNDTAFEAMPSSDNGYYTIVRSMAIKPTPTPVPTVMPTPAPMPCPTPVPDDMGRSVPIMVTLFAVGAVAGAACIFIVFKRK